MLDLELAVNRFLFVIPDCVISMKCFVKMLLLKYNKFVCLIFIINESRRHSESATKVNLVCNYINTTVGSFT